MAKVAIPVTAPQLWSVDHPNLYTVRTTVLSDDKPVDSVDTTCGFRTIRFDAKKGFFLNDQPLKLQGHLQSPGPCGRRRRRAGFDLGIPRPQIEGDGLERLSHRAQSAVEGVARCLRPPGHARDGRDPAFQHVAGIPAAARVAGAPRPQSPERDPLVPVQRGGAGGQRGGHGDRAHDERRGQAARHDPAHHRRAEQGTTRPGRQGEPEERRAGRGRGRHQLPDRRIRQDSRGLSRQADGQHGGHLPDHDARGIRHRLDRNVVGSYDDVFPGWDKIQQRPQLVGSDRRAAVLCRRLLLDGLRLPRRAHAIRMAVGELAFRRAGSLRLPEDRVLRPAGAVGEGQAGADPGAALELAGQGGPERSR